MAIELVGYKPIVKNSLYLRNRNKSETRANILLLRKFREPTEDQVVRLIKRAVKYSLDGIIKQKNYLADLSEFLNSLPKSTLSRMYKGNKYVFDILRSETDALDKCACEADKYLLIDCGVIKTKTLDEKLQKKSIEDYCRAISVQTINDRDLGWKFSVIIKLDDYFKLPERSIIDFLVNERATSRRLRVDGMCSVKNVEDVIETIYNSLSDEYSMYKLPDFSRTVLVEAATSAVRKLIDYLKEKENVTKEVEDNIKRGIRTKVNLESGMGLFGDS